MKRPLNPRLSAATWGTRARKNRVPKRARRGPQERGERTRAEILVAAETLFAEHGYSGVSLEAIALRAGMHQPGIHYYFPTKRALYEAVVGAALGTVEDLTLSALAARSPPRARLIAMVEAWVDLLAGRPTLARLMLHEAANPDSTAMPRIFAELGQRIGKRLTEVFGELGLDVPADSVFHFQSLVTGTTLFYAGALQRMVSGTNEADVLHSMDHHKRLLVRATRTFLDDLRTKPRTKETNR